MSFSCHLCIILLSLISMFLLFLIFWYLSHVSVKQSHSLVIYLPFFGMFLCVVSWCSFIILRCCLSQSLRLTLLQEKTWGPLWSVLILLCLSWTAGRVFQIPQHWSGARLGIYSPDILYHCFLPQREAKEPRLFSSTVSLLRQRRGNVCFYWVVLRVPALPGSC